ncbi:hypothetical protein [Natribacillus halophilus]|uniref:Uncharacterized protein n=1 Tax=Natribacillus halophilus TaxID=549003 RepID=A0A1G8RV74_9BACI|nr:hypothetical protein [Natribacillus halophilus]SDJ20240.1 hypothetical protein SAMN04488123_12039 [Natribacillus halophilus]
MRTKRTFPKKQTDQIKWQREVIISEMHDTKTDERMKQIVERV